MLVRLLIILIFLWDGLIATDFTLNIDDEEGIKHLYNIRIMEQERNTKAAGENNPPNIEEDIKQLLSKNLDSLLLEKSNIMSSYKELVDSIKNFYTKLGLYQVSNSGNDGSFSNPFSLSQYFGTQPMPTQSGNVLTYELKVKKLMSESMLFPMELHNDCYLPGSKSSLPYALCNENLKSPLQADKQTMKSYENGIVDSNKLNIMTGYAGLDRDIAHAIILLNTGHVAESIKELLAIIKENPELPLPYYVLSVGHLRMGEKKSALDDINQGMDRDNPNAEPHERKRGVYTMLGRLNEALIEADLAVSFDSTFMNHYQRGLLHFVLENWHKAEYDFRRSLELRINDTPVMHKLALTLLLRGKIRNAINILNDIMELDPKRLESMALLGEALRQLGDYDKALVVYKNLLDQKPPEDIALSVVESRGSLYYSAGHLDLALQDSTECLRLHTQHPICLYLRSLVLTSLGQYYEGIKAATKLMILDNSPQMRLTPEFVKVHYLREWARYIHSRLDGGLLDYNISSDLPANFRDKWMKSLPMELVYDYTEQSGLQPQIPDISPPRLSSYPTRVQDLICRVKKTAELFYVDSDGYVNNERLTFALAMASFHVAQVVEQYWSDLLQSASKGSTKSVPKLTWHGVVDLITRYHHMADPDLPLIWLSHMPADLVGDGYSIEKVLLRGSMENAKLMPYYNIVFQLVKTMVEYMRGENKVTPSRLEKANQEIKEARTCEDLLTAARKKNAVSPNGGIMVSTQVPSLKNGDGLQHEGDMIMLTEDSQHGAVLSLNVLVSPNRIKSYAEEIDFLFVRLTDEVLRARQRVTKATNNGTPISDEDSRGLVDLTLSILYYLVNARPLSHGSGLVSYSMALGLMMALGYEVQGRLPPGKLIDMDPLLAGTPDAFIVVTRQWIKLKRMSFSVTTLPSVAQTFPTVRSILEVLPVGTLSKCPV